MLQQVKIFLLLFFGFVVWATLGSVILEGTRMIVAAQLGYNDPRFSKNMVTFLYSNESLNVELEKHRKKYPNFEITKKTESWQALTQKYNRHMAIIDASAIVMAFMLCLVGVFLLRKDRSRVEMLGVKHWIGFFISLVFLLYLIDFTYKLALGFMWIQKMALFHVLGLIKEWPLAIFPGLGILLALWIVFQLPKRYRLPVMLAGIPGSYLGLRLWGQVASFSIEGPNISHLIFNQLADAVSFVFLS